MLQNSYPKVNIRFIISPEDELESEIDILSLDA